MEDYQERLTKSNIDRFFLENLLIWKLDPDKGF